MRFDRLHLQNFKCHEHVDLSLSEGVTVIHGLNGSGKSSLLEACFFALYGSKALDQTLEEIVTIGAEETIVELWFTHAGESYHLRRRIRVSSGDARTVECVLEGPEHTTEGARDVRERIATLLRMDTDAFVNCAYVRQGEVNKLINASPSVRQDMLDDLLQLGKLEEYRERASDARLGVGHVRDDKRGALAEIEEQIEGKDEQELHERRNAIESTLSEISADIERYEANRDEAEDTLDTAETVIEEHEQKREDLADLEEAIEGLRERIQNTEREREQLGNSLTENQETLADAREKHEDLLDSVEVDATDEETLADRVSDRIEEIQTDIDDITEEIRELSVEKKEHDSDAEQHRERASDLEETAAEKREKADELETELTEAREDLAERAETIEDMTADIEQKRATFENEAVEFGETQRHREKQESELSDLRAERAETGADLENAREQLSEAKDLREAGKCPECGQPVEDSPHVDAISEYRERVEALESDLESLDDRETNLEEAVEHARELETLESEIEQLETERGNLQQILDQREETIAEKEERIEDLRAEAESHEETVAEKREHADAAQKRASECQQEIAECNQEKQAYKNRLDTLETLADVLGRISTLENDIETLREKREEKAEMNEERREQLAEKREARTELKEAFDEGRIESAREQKQKAQNYLEDVRAELERLDEKQASLQGDLGAVENELEALGQLRERRETLAETVERLDSLYSEAEQLQEMYGTLKGELRQRNIESLERMLNETFELVYTNDTYARIEIDGEYRLTVYQKDGEPLDPQQLSGGERALFNLSLRCAIYQLLAEGIEGAAPMPPLILDEPTVFLDDGHVSQLVELVGAMRELGVEQILVVSHDEELVAAADHLVTVRKNPTTNRSTVEHADRVEEQLLAGAGD